MGRGLGCPGRDRRQPQSRGGSRRWPGCRPICRRPARGFMVWKRAAGVWCAERHDLDVHERWHGDPNDGGPPDPKSLARDLAAGRRPRVCLHLYAPLVRRGRDLWRFQEVRGRLTLSENEESFSTAAQSAFYDAAGNYDRPGSSSGGAIRMRVESPDGPFRPTLPLETTGG